MIGHDQRAPRRDRTLPATATVAFFALASAGCGYDFGAVEFADASGSGGAPTGGAGGAGGGPGPGSSSTGGGAATSSSSASSSTASSSTGGACSEASDCDPVATACFHAECVGSACSVVADERGAGCGPTGEQLCDDAGACVACLVASDCPQAGSPCSAVACEGSVCTESRLGEGEPCLGQDGSCSDEGTCVECIDETDCAAVGARCIDGVCEVFDPTCSNLVLDLGETDVDCGGPCPPCADTLACSVPDDCASGFCSGTVCTACSTHQQCGAGYCSGGVCLDRELEGQPCAEDEVCQSGFCVDGLCCESACTGTCRSCRIEDNGVANGKCAGNLVDSDPEDECANGNPCLSGLCDGGGQCKLEAGECPDVCTVNEQTGMASVRTGQICTDGECNFGSLELCGAGIGCNADGTACE